MNRGILAALLFTAGCSVAPAAELVVTTDGNTLWTRQVIRSNATVRCVLENDSGSTRDIPAAQVFEIIPVVQRGARNTPEQASDALARLDKVAKHYPLLRKQLNVMESDWRAVIGDSTTSTAEIDETVTAFRQGARDESTFTSTLMSLEMARYKDVQGKHIARLDSALEQVKELYYGVSLTNMESVARRKQLSADEFQKLRADGYKVLERRPPREDLARVTNAVGMARSIAIRSALASAEKKFSEKTVESFAEGRKIVEESIKKLTTTAPQARPLEEALARGRTETLQAAATAALNTFGTKRTIPVYLKSRSTLEDLLTTVAATPDDRAFVKKQVERLISAAAKVHQRVDFTLSGFPLGTTDIQNLGLTRAYASLNPLPTGSPDEAVLIIPQRPISPLRSSDTLQMPAMLVFNRVLPPKCELTFVLVGQQNGAPVEYQTPLVLQPIKDGHMKVDIQIPLSSLAGGTVPFEDAGTRYYALYVAFRTDESKAWKPISMACRIPAIVAP